MKRTLALVMACAVAVAIQFLCADSATARSEYKGRLEAAVKGTKAADAIKEQKCNACHFGKEKKNRNAFGEAMIKHLTKEQFQELKADKEKLAKKVDEAIQATLKDKSPDGKTFGELIEAGQLPAKNPE